MNDSTRPRLLVSATVLVRALAVAEVEALVLRGYSAGAAVRHVAGGDRVDLKGRPGRRATELCQLAAHGA